MKTSARSTSSSPKPIAPSIPSPSACARDLKIYREIAGACMGLRRSCHANGHSRETRTPRPSRGGFTHAGGRASSGPSPSSTPSAARTAQPGEGRDAAPGPGDPPHTRRRAGSEKHSARRRHANDGRARRDDQGRLAPGAREVLRAIPADRVANGALDEPIGRGEPAAVAPEYVPTSFQMPVAPEETLLFYLRLSPSLALKLTSDRAGSSSTGPGRP